MGDENSLKTLDHAVSLLELLASHGQELGISEMGRRLSISKAATHRLACTLEGRGYLIQNPATQRYYLGVKCWEIGCQAVNRLGLREVAFPHLEDLWRSTGETVYLATYDSGQVVWVEMIESPKAVRVHTRLGARAPAYCVACGKVILAFQPAAEIEHTLGSLQPFTSTTIVDAQALAAEIEQIRRQGYAVSMGEWEPGVIGLAAPVRDKRRRVVASVGLSAPRTMVTPGFEAEMAPLLIAKADAISVALGYLPSFVPSGRTGAAVSLSRSTIEPTNRIKGG